LDSPSIYPNNSTNVRGSSAIRRESSRVAWSPSTVTCGRCDAGRCRQNSSEGLPSMRNAQRPDRAGNANRQLVEHASGTLGRSDGRRAPARVGWNRRRTWVRARSFSPRYAATSGPIVTRSRLSPAMTRPAPDGATVPPRRGGDTAKPASPSRGAVRLPARQASRRRPRLNDQLPPARAARRARHLLRRWTAVLSTAH